MQNAMKRAFTSAVAVATILGSVGMSAFVAPLSASAATTLSNGNLIKGSLSTVYYFYNGERFTFPNEKTYASWYSDFSGVMTVSDSQLASYPLAGNIVVRPGTYMVKIDTDPKTYVVTRGGGIRWVETEAVATDLFGSAWNTKIIDVPDVFFTDYTEQSSMMTAAFVDGMMVASGTSTYIIWDGMKDLVTSAGMSANGLQSKFIMSASSVSLSDYTTGSTISGEVPALSDASQQATGSTTTAGDLTASLSSSSPSGQTVPADATNVQLMAVNLKAASSDVAVSGLTFHFTGVADNSIFDNLYVYVNGERLSNGKSINSTTRDVTFSSLGINVTAGSTVTAWLTGDVAATGFGSATVNFELASADSITSTASTVGGTFPIMSYSNSLTDAASVGTATISSTGSLSDATIGQDNAEVARFTVDAASEDAVINSITLNIDNSADHSDFKLWQSSTELATGTDIGGDLVLFTLADPYTVLDGSTKTFKVTAKIGGTPGDDVMTALEETSDLNVTGGDFGYGMLVDNSNYDDNSATNCNSSGDPCSFMSIIGGKLTFAFNGPTAANKLQIGGDDQTSFDFTLTSQNAATVSRLEFTFAGTDLCSTTTFANFQNIRVVKADGSTFMGPEELDCSALSNSQTLIFNDEQDLTAGQSLDLSLVADIKDNGDAASSDTNTVTLLSTLTQAQDGEGNDLTVGTDIIPSANLVGNALTLNDASLTINLASSPTSGTVVKGSQTVNMVGFSFAAGSASDITVTDATLHILVDSDGNDVFDEAGDITALAADDRITSCSIYNSAGDLIDGPESVNSSANLIFSGFNWTIAGGETEKMLVTCNLANLAVVATPDEFAVEIAATTSITAEDADGNELSGSALVLTGGNIDDAVEIGVVASGTLSVAIGADSPLSTIIIGNSSDVEVGTFRFTATTEDFVVNKTIFNIVGQTVVADTVSVSYEDESGTTITKSGVVSGTTATFDNLGMFVPADGTADMTMTIDTSVVSGTGANSGDAIQFVLDESLVEYTGLSSGTTQTDTASVSDATAASFELHKTKPTLSKASGSPSGNSIPGVDEVLRFNVAADSHGFVTLNVLTFKMTSTDNATTLWNACDGSAPTMATSDFTLYNITDLSTAVDGGAADWTLLDSAGGACSGTDVLTYIELNLTTPAEIAAGTTKTYALYVDTTGASTSTTAGVDSARFDIPRQSELDGVSLNESIGWDDDTQGTGFDGTLVKTLPVTGGTLVY